MKKAKSYSLLKTCLNNVKVNVTLKMKIKGEQPHQIHKIPKKT